MRITLLLAFFLITLFSCDQKSKEDRASKKSGHYAQRADSVLSLMTIDEKIGQLNLPGAGDINTGQASNSNIAGSIRKGNVGGLFNIKTAKKIREVQRIAVEESRLKIPLIFGMDVIHGYKTVFPIPLALSCTWNPEMIELSARVAAKEASADGICWTFSPMVDIARDPRWGRIAEGGGEDPFLGSEIARAMVRGYQGNNLADNNTIMACVKHMALYGASEAGRDYNTTDMSRIRMYNEYLAPYRAALEEGAGSIMTSFNEIDGIPASANKWLLTELLRNQWKFNGFVVTDYTAINEMSNHGLGDLKTVSALALHAGVDMDMVGEGFLTTLKQSLQNGAITEKQIDIACARILEAKFKLGLFDDPYKYCDLERAKTEIFTEENKKIAREITAESFVLLKNEGRTLPLKKRGVIALVGPMADNRENMSGTWSVAADVKQAISLREGIEAAVGDKAQILYARGANIYGDSILESRVSIFGKPTYRDSRPETDMIREAVRIAHKADVIVAAVGESAEMTGESSSRTDIGIPGVQRDLLKALKETGKPVVLVLFTGRPLTLAWEENNFPAILNVWFAGSEAGHAIADVLFGDVNPSGKITATFPRNVGQVPIYYSHKNTGRPLPPGVEHQKFTSNYLDVSNEPLYPFGYGLGYSAFDYSNLKLSDSVLYEGKSIQVSVDVENTGNYDGKEVVQLYTRDMVGSITRPVKELKGFKKIALKKGERTTVLFSLAPEDLAFYSYDLTYGYEPGKFEVYAGGNSRDVLSASFVLKTDTGG